MQKNKWIWIWAVVAVLIVLFTNLYSVYMLANAGSFVSGLLLLITHSGDALSVAFLVLLFVFFVSKRVKSYKNRLFTIVVLWLFLLIVLGGVALLNEHLFKTTFHVHRPSIEIMKQQVGFDSDKMYQLDSKELRRGYLKDFFESRDDVRLEYDGKHVTESVLKLWKYEVGYSFPSGHATNAFLLAIVICYLLSYLYKGSGAVLYGCIYLWAVWVAMSRVMLGVHSALDISFGALWGTLLGVAFVKSGSIKSVFLNKTHN
ncbi:phosphatase PAP2 family protein [Plebeiibacterium marinum]|uniref:Phosphatase PAP2 family protein n=1 Tax=Plebeiibacterium marinum TaxID=2992111 RepID=A0AAE3MFC7_9BACT|nr:phosphatase PAP2 family protein [Plebeiobacterium marinum]MCW3806027.1 phosphatase PAP2 family protein [Plebeiobacterium marinum]